jgi:ABC-type nickel/cobalt efflux system permease component RcnA
VRIGAVVINADDDGSEKQMLELQRWLYGEASTQLKALGSGLEPLSLLSAVCIAALFGLVHALMPGHGKTALIGAIWQVKDNLSFDIGFRHAIVNGAGVNEVRAGLTYGFPL